MCTQCMHVSISMRVWLHRRTDRRCGPAARTRPRAASVRARACARAIGRARIRAEPCERVPSAVDRGWFGSQMFTVASAFNADIGAWNTAAVMDLYGVCAAFSATGGAPPQAGRARRVVDAARAVVRGGTADAARACVYAQTCGHTHARMPTCVGIASRSKDGIHVFMDIHAYI